MKTPENMEEDPDDPEPAQIYKWNIPSVVQHKYRTSNK
jgi:hypothetical protein